MPGGPRSNDRAPGRAQNSRGQKERIIERAEERNHERVTPIRYCGDRSDVIEASTLWSLSLSLSLLIQCPLLNVRGVNILCECSMGNIAFTHESWTHCPEPDRGKVTGGKNIQCSNYLRSSFLFSRSHHRGIGPYTETLLYEKPPGKSPPAALIAMIFPFSRHVSPSTEVRYLVRAIDEPHSSVSFSFILYVPHKPSKQILIIVRYALS